MVVKDWLTLETVFVYDLGGTIAILGRYAQTPDVFPLVETLVFSAFHLALLVASIETQRIPWCKIARLYINGLASIVLMLASGELMTTATYLYVSVILSVVYFSQFFRVIRSLQDDVSVVSTLDALVPTTVLSRDRR